jgi:hypothetical protein
MAAERVAAAETDAQQRIHAVTAELRTQLRDLQSRTDAERLAAADDVQRARADVEDAERRHAAALSQVGLGLVVRVFFHPG